MDLGAWADLPRRVGVMVRAAGSFALECQSLPQQGILDRF